MPVLADIEQGIRDFIGAAEDVLNSPAVKLGFQDGQHLDWLLQVFQCKIGELNSILADLESGLSIQQIGFASLEAFEQELDELQAHVRSLKQQIESLRQNAHCK